MAEDTLQPGLGGVCERVGCGGWVRETQQAPPSTRGPLPSSLGFEISSLISSLLVTHTKRSQQNPHSLSPSIPLLCRTPLWPGSGP